MPQIEAGNVLMVGDNPQTDVAGAAGVGMETCWFNSHEMPAWIAVVNRIPHAIRIRIQPTLTKRTMLSGLLKRPRHWIECAVAVSQQVMARHWITPLAIEFKQAAGSVFYRAIAVRR